jgi:anion-transporting  ArsA/GET3 family ATPase
MTIQEAHRFFENLKERSNKKSEIRIYDRFIKILKALTERGLSAEDLGAVENKLAELDLRKPGKRLKQYNKALNSFENFLRTTLSLVTKSFYTTRGIALGMVFGMLAGIIIYGSLPRSMGISMGLPFGMILGLVIGRNLDHQAGLEGRVI